MFKATICTTCRTYGNTSVQYEGTVSENDINYATFSARRLPDRKFYTWARCKSCSLLRSDPILEVDLQDLYTKSTFDYSNEIPGLQKTYKKLMVKYCDNLNFKSSILEVGGGNGFVLDTLIDSGYENVRGIEPSEPAVSAARPDVKPKMIVDMLRPNLIAENSQDVIVMFHVLDHLPDPLNSIELIYSLLKPGGTFVVAVHNERSWSAKFLRTKSPIYDVEHTYLFSRKSANNLFKTAGFEKIRTESYPNFYSLGYVAQLLPMPTAIKRFIISAKYLKFIYKIPLRVSLGNMVIVGTKKHSEINLDVRSSAE